MTDFRRPSDRFSGVVMADGIGRKIKEYLPSRIVGFIFLVGLAMAMVGYCLPEKGNPFVAFSRVVLVEIGDVMSAFMLITYAAEKAKEVPLSQRLAKSISDEFAKTIFHDLNAKIFFGLIGMEAFLDFGAIFNDLTEGDEVYVLATYIGRDRQQLGGMLAAALRGAKFKCLILAEDSPMLPLRANELIDEYPETPALHYKNDLRHTLSRLNHVKSQLTPECQDNLIFLTFTDLIGSPIYLKFTHGRPAYAWSSSYLAHNSVPSLMFRQQLWICRSAECGHSRHDPACQSCFVGVRL
jgi:hypothetical protein